MIFLKLGNLNFDDEEDEDEDDGGGPGGGAGDTVDSCCCSRLYLPFLGLTWEFIAFSILLYSRYIFKKSSKVFRLSFISLSNIDFCFIFFD